MGSPQATFQAGHPDPWYLPLHSLRSFHGQVPRVTQRSPSGCFAALSPCCHSAEESGELGIARRGSQEIKQNHYGLGKVFGFLVRCTVLVWIKNNEAAQ